MFPDESVQAAIDANARKIMPVHWAGFSLAQHHWTEPVEKFIQTADQKSIDYLSPKLGELVSLDQPFLNSYWWRD